MGASGGTTLQDPVRGIMNEAGLYGTNHGWDLPGYPDQDWQPVTLPDSWAARGIPPGVGWYRTSFSMNLPQQSYVPVDVQIGRPGPGAGTADYRAFIFVNGWLIGRYVNNVGPQHQFYVPAGILNEHGGNTIAIAVWGLNQVGGGLDQVSLVAAGNQAGGIPVAPVASPGYDAAVYGPPSSPQPTLAAVPSTTIETSSFTVKETLANPSQPPLQDAAMSLTAPAGWTVSPSGPVAAGTVGRGAAASATFTVTAPSSGLSPGAVSLLATATYRQQGTATQTLINTAQVQVPYPNLSAAFDNPGSSDDTNTAAGNLDGAGYSFSAQALAAAGVTPGSAVKAGGVSFTWPDVPPGQPDNVIAAGQAISVNGTGSALGFLVTATFGQASGTGTIYYTDGTTQAFTVTSPDWYTTPPPAGSDAAITMAYRNAPGNVQDQHPVHVYDVVVPLAQGKTVQAVALPSTSNLHVFAIGLG